MTTQADGGRTETLREWCIRTFVTRFDDPHERIIAGYAYERGLIEGAALARHEAELAAPATEAMHSSSDPHLSMHLKGERK